MPICGFMVSINSSGGSLTQSKHIIDMLVKFSAMKK